MKEVKPYKENFVNVNIRFYGVTVSTRDFDSLNPSSNLGRTSFYNF